VFQLPKATAAAVMAGKPVKVTKNTLEIVESILTRELQYAFSARILKAMETDSGRKNLLLWVHTAAAMVCMFRSLKSVRAATNFVNGYDPFMAPLNSMYNVLDEVEKFLYRIHENLPQFDEQFFSGTGFLRPDEVTLPMVEKQRVPSSVDVLSLSKKDRERRKNLKQNKGAQDGNYSEERGPGRVRQEPDNPCDKEGA